MKSLKLAILIVVFSMLMPYQAWGWTVKLVFEQGFSNQFMPDSTWAGVDSSAVKDLIISRVTDDYDPFNISVSTSSGDVVVYIGRYGDNYGWSFPAIGAYADGDAYAEVYCNHFAAQSEWQGSNATVARIAEGIAGTTSHEAGHLFNLYHDYMFDSYDPTLPGALNATLPAPWTGSSYYPAGIGWYFDGPGSEGFCSQCIADSSNAKNHLMARKSDPAYLTKEESATINRYFAANSSQILNFVVSNGANITRNTVWGLENRTFSLSNDVSISSGKTLIIGNNGYTHNMNGHTMTGTIENHGTISPEIGVRNESVNGMFSAIKDALQAADAGDTVFVETGTTTLGDVSTNVTIDEAVAQHDSIKLSWQAHGSATHYFIRYGTSTGSYDRFLAMKNTYTSVEIDSLTNDEQYYFKVNGSSSEFTNFPRYCRTDYDSLGTIDFPDFLRFVAAWGKSEGQGGYEQRFDLSGNKVVDYPDSTLFVGDYNKSCNQLPKPALSPILASGENRNVQPSFVVRQSNDEVEVALHLENISNLVGYEAAIHYDPSMLEYVKTVDDQGIFKRENAESAFGFVKNEDGLLLIVAANTGNNPVVDGQGELVRIVFRKRNAVNDSPPVFLHDLLLADDAWGVDRFAPDATFVSAPKSSEGQFKTALGQNTPNPFNPSTTISFMLAEDGVVDLAIFNTLGQEVRRLIVKAHLLAGQHQVVWDGRDALGNAVASGIYMYKMRTKNFEGVQRMVMLK